VSGYFSNQLEPRSFLSAGYEVNESRGVPYPYGFTPTIHPYRLEEPLQTQTPQFIFTGSMGDIFDPAFPNGYRRQIFDVMKKASWHTFMVITKNPRELKRFVNDYGAHNMPDNLWLGVTAETQAKAKQRIPVLLSIPRIKCFVNFEPLMGPIRLELFLELKSANRIQYIIVGGMTGPDAMPMNPNWVRGIRDVSLANHIPFNFKQWGEWEPLENVQDQLDREELLGFDSHGFADGERMLKVGRKNAGRLLDGREHRDRILFLGEESQKRLFEI
jgi:protein gp37